MERDSRRADVLPPSRVVQRVFEVKEAEQREERRVAKR